jgi:hypothetical protein
MGFWGMLFWLGDAGCVKWFESVRIYSVRIVLMMVRPLNPRERAILSPLVLWEQLGLLGSKLCSDAVRLSLTVMSVCAPHNELFP